MWTRILLRCLLTRLGAVLTVWVLSGEGLCQTQWGSYAFSTFAVGAPVADGAGRYLEGTGFLAMLYGAATPDDLRAVPPALSFQFGDRAGHLVSTGVDIVRYVPGVQPMAVGYVQVRAWNARLGPTYEAVADRGLGGYGESEVLRALSGWADMEVLPQPLKGLTSFRLRPVVSPVVFARVQGRQVLIDWVGDMPRYQLEQKGRVDEPWVPLGDPVTTNSFTLASTNAAQFIRVVALPK